MKTNTKIFGVFLFAFLISSCQTNSKGKYESMSSPNGAWILNTQTGELFMYGGTDLLILDIENKTQKTIELKEIK